MRVSLGLGMFPTFGFLLESDMTVASEAGALDYVSKYCGLLFEATDCVDNHVGALPDFTVWGPLNAAPVITDMRCDHVLVEDVDFIWTTFGQIFALVDLSPTVWQIEYNAGHVGVPDGLIAIVAALAKELENEVASGNLQSEKLGDYSWASGSPGEGVAASARMRGLDLWRRMI